MMAMDEFKMSYAGYSLPNRAIIMLFSTLGALINVSKSSFRVKLMFSRYSLVLSKLSLAQSDWKIYMMNMRIVPFVIPM